MLFMRSWVLLFMIQRLICGMDVQEDHKIVYMITLARSTSTAFLRMMYERGDFTIFHEPGGCAYNMVYAPHIVDKVFLPDAPRTFEEIYKRIMQSADERNVFIKEMRPIAEEFLTACPEIAADSRVQFVFLVRHPHGMLISNYLIRKDRPSLSLEQLHDRLSYAFLYCLFEKIAAASVNRPIVIASEDLCANPEAVIQDFCTQVGIPYMPDCLSWNSYDEQFDVREWNGTTNMESVQHWHGEAIKSTSIHQARTYTCDTYGEPTFEEIDSEEWRQFYRQLYEESLPYYRLLSEASKPHERGVLHECLREAELVEVQRINPSIQVDLIWATGKNSLGLVIYPDGATCYLHKEAAYALDAIQKELAVYGYGLKILEGFRPLWAQKIIWEAVQFVPPSPEYGRHTLGTAVDITLIMLNDGSLIPLPSLTVHETIIDRGVVEELTAEQMSNYALLKGLMVKYGFEPHDIEWYHFDYAGWRGYASLNYQFPELAV